MRRGAYVLWMLSGMVCTLLGGCDTSASTERDTRASSLVRDSAGVTIVESVAPIWEPAQVWRLAPKPSIDFASLGDQPEYQLFSVAGAVTLSDGTVVVANQGTSEIRYYAPDGSYLATVGGEGDGPGEFNYISTISPISGDSILVSDPFSRRTTTFDSQGNFGTTTQLADLGPSFGTHQVFPLSTSHLIALPWATVLRQGGLSYTGLARPVSPVVRFTRSGELVDTLLSVPGNEVWVGTGQSIEVIPNIRPLVTLATRDEFYTGLAEEMEIHRYSGDGVLQAIMRIPSYDLQMTPEEVTRSHEDFLSRARNESDRRRMQATLDAAPPRDRRPAYSQFLVDPLGNLWVAHTFIRMFEPRYEALEVFNSEGRWLGTFTLPEPMRVLEVGGDYLTAVYTDNFDVETLRIYPLYRN